MFIDVTIGVHKVIIHFIGSRIPLFPKHEPLQHGLHEAAQAQVAGVQAPAETVKMHEISRNV